jgi:hypothetical protein
MSRIKYGYGWTDPRMPRLDAYVYEVRRTSHLPWGKWEVVKSSLLHSDVNEVLAVVDSREVAEGFIKLLKEN